MPSPSAPATVVAPIAPTVVPDASATSSRQRRQFVDDEAPGIAEGASSLGPGACVEVYGLESESGRVLNGQRGIIQQSIEATGRLQVRLGPDKIVSLKPASLKKVELTVAERLQVLGLAPAQPASDAPSSVPEARAPTPAALSSATTSAAAPSVGAPTVAAPVEPEAAAAEPLPMPTNLPFRPGQCVEVVGLESEGGKLLNGQSGLIVRYVVEKARFEVSLDKTVALKADNLRLVEFSFKLPESGGEKAEEADVEAKQCGGSRSRSRSRTGTSAGDKEASKDMAVDSDANQPEMTEQQRIAAIAKSLRGY